MGKSAGDILLEIEQLQARLDEAEQLLRTLGPELANLSDTCPQANGSDPPGPHLPSRIPEEAAILAPDGRILRCGIRFARMLRSSPSRLLGSSIYQHVAGDDAPLASLLKRGAQDRTSGQIKLAGTNGRTRSVRIAVQPVPIKGVPGACMLLAHPDKEQQEKPPQQVGRDRRHPAAMIAEREQQQIGRDLRDVLGQTLAGVTLLGQTLHLRLQNLGCREAVEVERIISLAGQGLRQLQDLAATLQAVEPGPDGLRKALGEYAADVASLYGVACRFEWDGRTWVTDQEIATHLYRIAQEAVRSAVRHGKATRISIRLAGNDQSGRVELDIASDGIDFPGEKAKRRSGLRIMNYRARAIGASLRNRRRTAGETHVTCSVPGSMGVAEVQSKYDTATGSDK